MSRNSQVDLLRNIATLLEPFRTAAESKLILRELAEHIGWDLDSIAGFPVDALTDRLAEFVQNYDQMIALIDPPPERLEDLARLLEASAQTFHSIRDLHSILDGPGIVKPPQFVEFGKDLVSFLSALYLEAWQPVIYHLGVVLSVIRAAEELPFSEPVTGEPGSVVRFPHVRPGLRPRRIVDLMRDPIPVLREEYLHANGLATREGARHTADKLFPRLAGLMNTLGVATMYGIKPAYGLDFGTEGNELAAGVMTVWVDSDLDEVVGASLALSSEEEGGLGLVVMPFGAKKLTGTAGGWALEIELVADADVFAVGDKGVVRLEDVGARSVTVRFSADRLPEADQGAYSLGSTTATRLQIQHFRVSAEATFTGTSKDYGFVAEVGSAALVVASGDGDGFLREVLPSEGLEIDFDLAAGWSNHQGLYLRGGGSLEANLPVHATVGPLSIQSVQLSIQPSGDAVLAAAAASVRVRLGAVTALVERVGLKAVVTFPDDGGNVGIANLTLGFKPPTGISLSIDGGGFKGGGFLAFEPENKRYTGVLELEFKESIALKAVGLLTTELPGGEPGFSLLIVITAEFQPIQLGLGFTLNGVGGLLGLNRTARVERLRTGLRDNTLSSILFPTDVIANANRIISDLREVFPPQADRFVFGPMAKLGWGSPTIITIDLGLVIEVPAPVQLAILGVLRGLIPDENKKLLRLQVNFLGVIEFEEQRLAFDASLYDSKLLNYPLSGDMALRLTGGNTPNLLLTVGGFHPAYESPSVALPKLRRLTLLLTSGDNPRLTLETYFAVTSNTVQFGARVELYAKAGSFNVYGMLAFDVLFQFNPFYFVADVTAKLALRKGSSSIAGITISMTLEGTTPWRAKGTARLKLAWFLTVKVRFDRTFGDRLDTRLNNVAVLPLLREALEDQRNWRPGLPASSHLLVSVRESEGTGERIVAHPVGVLEVSQKVVPLNVRIERFGHRLPSDGREFRIQNIRVNGDAVGSSGVKESFAPAQFFEMSDAQKLSSKPFEKYDAGVAFTGDEGLSSDSYAMREVEYELSYRDSQRDQLPPPAVVKPDAVAFDVWASKGAVARSSLSFAKAGKSVVAPGAVSVIQEGYGVVGMGDLSLVNQNSIAASEAEAVALMSEFIAQDPALMGRIQVVPLFEAVGSAP